MRLGRGWWDVTEILGLVTVGRSSFDAQDAAIKTCKSYHHAGRTWRAMRGDRTEMIRSASPSRRAIGRKRRRGSGFEVSTPHRSRSQNQILDVMRKTHSGVQV